MENRPVIMASGVNCPREILDRYWKWQMEVYTPLLMKNTSLLGVDYYIIVRESPLYPKFLGIRHYPNFNSYESSLKTQVRRDINQDIDASWTSHGRERVWLTLWHLIRSFRKEAATITVDKEEKGIAIAGLLHLEALKLSTEQQVQYDRWLNEFGYEVSIPLLMQLPGIRGYDCFKNTGWRSDMKDVRETDYPEYLSLVYFENLGAYENYEKSRELAASRKALKADVSGDPDFKWYVQYQLIKSFRK